MIRQEARAVQAGEVVILPFDYQKYLDPGETISSPTVAVTLFTGVDATPNAILSGAASVSGSVGKQAVAPTLVGNVYSVEMTVSTSGGQILISETTLAVVLGEV